MDEDDALDNSEEDDNKKWRSNDEDGTGNLKQGSPVTGSSSSMYQSAVDDEESDDESSKSVEELNTEKCIKSSNNSNVEDSKKDCDHHKLNDVEDDGSNESTEADDDVSAELFNLFASNTTHVNKSEEEEERPTDPLSFGSLNEDGLRGDRLDTVEEVTEPMSSDFFGQPLSSFTNDSANEKCQNITEEERSISEIEVASNRVTISYTNQRRAFGPGSRNERASIEAVESPHMNSTSLHSRMDESEEDNQFGPDSFPIVVDLSFQAVKALSKEKVNDNPDNRDHHNGSFTGADDDHMSMDDGGKGQDPKVTAFHSVEASPRGNDDESLRTFNDSEPWNELKKIEPQREPSTPFSNSSNKSNATPRCDRLTSGAIRTISLEFSPLERPRTADDVIDGPRFNVNLNTNVHSSRCSLGNSKKVSYRTSGFGGSTSSLSSASPLSEETNFSANHLLETNVADMSNEELRKQLVEFYYKWKKAEEDKHKIAHEAFMKASSIQRESQSKLQSVLWSQGRQAELISYLQSKVLDEEKKRKETEIELSLLKGNSRVFPKKGSSNEELQLVQKLSSDARCLRRQHLYLKTNLTEQLAIVKREANRVGERLSSSCLDVFNSVKQEANGHRVNFQEVVNGRLEVEKKLLKAECTIETLAADLKGAKEHISVLESEFACRKNEEQQLLKEEMHRRYRSLESHMNNIAVIADQHHLHDTNEEIRQSKEQVLSGSALGNQVHTPQPTTEVSTSSSLARIHRRSFSSSTLLGQTTQRAVENALENRLSQVKDLQTKLVSLQHNFDTISNDLDSKNATIQNLEQCLSNERDVCSNLNEELFQLRSTCKDLELQVEAAKEQRKVRDSEVQQFQIEYSNMSGAKCKIEERLKESDKTVEEFRLNEQALIKINENLKKTIREKEELIGKLEEVGSSYRDQYIETLDKLDKTSSILANQSQTDLNKNDKSLIEGELERLRESLQQLESENESLTASLQRQAEDTAATMETMEEVVKKGVKKASALEQQVHRQRDENERLVLKLKDNVGETTRLTKQVELLEEGKKSLELSLETVGNERDVIKIELEAATSEVDALAQELKSIRQEYKAMISVKTKIELKMADIEKEGNRMKQRDEDSSLREQQLLQAIAHLNSKSEEERYQLDTLKESIKQVREEKDYLTKEVKTLKQEIEATEQKHLQNANQNYSVINELRTRIEEQKTSLSSVTALEKKNASLQDRVGYLSTEKKSLHEELCMLKEEVRIQRLESKKSQEEKLVQLETEHEDTLSQISKEHKRDILMLTKKIETQNNLIKQLKNEIKEKEININTLMEREKLKKDSSMAITDQLRGEIEVLKKKLKDDDERRKSVKGDNLHLKVSQLETNLKDTTEKNRGLQEEISNLKTQVELKKSRINEIEEVLNETTAKLTSKDISIKKLEEQKTELMTKLVDLEFDYEDTNNKVISMEDELRVAQKRLQEELHKVAKTEQEVESCHSEIAIMEEQRENEIKAIMEQCQAIEMQSMEKENEVSKLNNKREALKSTIEEQQSVFDQLQLELKRAMVEKEMTVKTMATTVKNFRDKELKWRREKNTLELTMSALQRKVDDLDVKLSGEKVRIQQLEQTRSVLEKDRNEAEEKLRAITQVLRTLPATMTSPASTTEVSRTLMMDEVGVAKAIVLNAVNATSLLIKKRDEAEARVQGLQVQLRDQALSLESQEVSIAREREKGYAAEQQLQSLQLKLSNKDDELAKIQEELSSKDREISLLQSKVTVLEQSFETRERNVLAVAKKESMQQQETHKKIEGVLEELRVSEERLLQSRIESQRRESEIERLRQQLQNTQAQLKDHNDKLEVEVGRRIDRLESDLSRSRNTEEALRTRVHSLHDEIRAKERNIKNSNEEQRSISNQLQQCQTTNKNLRDQLENSLKDRDESELLCRRLQQQLETLKEDLQYAQSKLNQLESNHSKGSSLLNSREHSKVNEGVGSAELMRLRLELDKARRERTELRRNADAYRREINGLRRELSQRDERLRKEQSQRRLLLSSSINQGRETLKLRSQLNKSLSRVQSTESLYPALQRESTHLHHSVQPHIRRSVRRRTASVDRATALSMFSPISKIDDGESPKYSEKELKSDLDKARRQLSFSEKDQKLSSSQLKN